MIRSRSDVQAIVGRAKPTTITRSGTTAVQLRSTLETVRDSVSRAARASSSRTSDGGAKPSLGKSGEADRFTPNLERAAPDRIIGNTIPRNVVGVERTVKLRDAKEPLSSVTGQAPGMVSVKSKTAVGNAIRSTDRSETARSATGSVGLGNRSEARDHNATSYAAREPKQSRTDAGQRGTQHASVGPVSRYQARSTSVSGIECETRRSVKREATGRVDDAKRIRVSVSGTGSAVVAGTRSGMSTSGDAKHVSVSHSANARNTDTTSRKQTRNSSIASANGAAVARRSTNDRSDGCRYSVSSSEIRGRATTAHSQTKHRNEQLESVKTGANRTLDRTASADRAKRGYVLQDSARTGADGTSSGIPRLQKRGDGVRDSNLVSVVAGLLKSDCATAAGSVTGSSKSIDEPPNSVAVRTTRTVSSDRGIASSKLTDASLDTAVKLPVAKTKRTVSSDRGTASSRSTGAQNSLATSVKMPVAKTSRSLKSTDSDVARVQTHDGDVANTSRPVSDADDDHGRVSGRSPSGSRQSEPDSVAPPTKRRGRPIKRVAAGSASIYNGVELSLANVSVSTLETDTGDVPPVVAESAASSSSFRTKASNALVIGPSSTRPETASAVAAATVVESPDGEVETSTRQEETGTTVACRLWHVRAKRTTEASKLSEISFDQLPMPEDQLLSTVTRGDLAGTVSVGSAAAVTAKRQIFQRQCEATVTTNREVRLKRWMQNDTSPHGGRRSVCYELWKLRKDGYSCVSNIPGSYTEILYYCRYFGITLLDQRTARHVALRSTEQPKKENVTMDGVLFPRNSLAVLSKKMLAAAASSSQRPDNV